MEPTVEKNSGASDGGFSVDELLDLHEFAEPELQQPSLVSLPSEADNNSNSNCSSSSVLLYNIHIMEQPLPAPDVGLPAHDAEEFEWVSRIMDDSLCEMPQLPRPQLPALAPAKPFVPARLPSPKTTLCTLSTEALVPVKARRSKRARAAVWSLSGRLSDTSSSSTTTTTISSCSSSTSFSSLVLYEPTFAAAVAAPPLLAKKLKAKNHKPKLKPKKRHRKPKPPSSAAPSAAGDVAGAGERRCIHCGVSKTPQWRTGPHGAKTLCNACGVRYKSGRLLPEYRPACSPTFVSSIHSNSHRKVLEMRRKKEEMHAASAGSLVASF